MQVLNVRLRLYSAPPWSSSDRRTKRAAWLRVCSSQLDHIKLHVSRQKLLLSICCASCLACACGHGPTRLRHGHSGRCVAVGRARVNLRSRLALARRLCRLALGSGSRSAGSPQGNRTPRLAALLLPALLRRCSGRRGSVGGTCPPGAQPGRRAAGPRRVRAPAARPPAALHLHQLLHCAALRRAQEAPAGAALALGRMHMPRLVQERLHSAQRARRQRGKGKVPWWHVRQERAPLQTSCRTSRGHSPEAKQTALLTGQARSEQASAWSYTCNVR